VTNQTTIAVASLQQMETPCAGVTSALKFTSTYENQSIGKR